jgi:hypothetical protein
MCLFYTYVCIYIHKCERFLNIENYTNRRYLAEIAQEVCEYMYIYINLYVYIFNVLFVYICMYKYINNCEMFLKTDNYINGRCLAEITKEVCEHICIYTSIYSY